MNQLTLGTEITVDASVISRWETGLEFPNSPQKVGEIAKALALSESDYHSLHLAWHRGSPRTHSALFVPHLRPEGVASSLDHSIDAVKQLRRNGQPKLAKDIANRDAVAALDNIQLVAWSSLHETLLGKLEYLLLELVKAGLDYLPRPQVRDGALNRVIATMGTISEKCRTEENQFLVDLAVEGATYVSGNTELAFKQTMELLQREDRILPKWRAEVLRAGAINAGKRQDLEALQKIDGLIRKLLNKNDGEFDPTEAAFLLEGLGRSWAGLNPGLGEEIIQEAWGVRGAAISVENSSLLRYVQLTRSEAEVVAAHRGGRNSGEIVKKLERSIEIAKEQGYDRYIYQLERNLKKVA